MQPVFQDLDRDGLVAWLVGRGEAAYRADQILRWVWARGVTSFAEMTDLPAALRDALESEFRFDAPEVLAAPLASDGTQKFLFGLDDGSRIESVLIPRERGEDGVRDRLTLCISSQVGCGMGCAFCATATLGFRRHLRAAEIVAQVVAVRRRLPADRPITNLVFMGMGEPLHNYEAVVRAIDVLTAEWGLGFSSRRITVSTVGLVPQMRRLLEDTRVNLAVSLTATTDAVRSRLMPVNRKYPLEELLGACRSLPLAPRKRITFEYVVLDGENDAEADADRLAGLLAGIRSKVNLIPFNPFPGAAFQPSPRGRLERFRERLLSRGVHATIRESRGRDIQAACGQLAAAEAEASSAPT